MIPIELRVTNFRSFKKTQALRFPEAPGLYFMQGLNEVEPSLQGNGAGKSTFWEALTWCIFGQTAKGLKAGDVGTWEVGKGTRVEFDFVAPSGEECTLIRTWKPNSWILQDMHASGGLREDLDKAERNAFLGWLGLGLRSWLSAVMMAQGEEMFLDLKPEPKAQLFAEIMELERWSEYAQRASKAASSLDKEIRGMEQDLAAIRGELEALDRSSFDEDGKAWEARRDKRLQAIEVEHEQTIEYSTLKEDLKAAEEAERFARDALQVAKADTDKAWEQVKREEGEVRDVEVQLARAEAKQDEADKHLSAVGDDNYCRACGQEIDQDTWERHGREARAALEELEKKTKWLRAKLASCRDSAASSREAYNRIRDKEDSLRRVLNGCEDEAVKLRRDLLAEDRRLDELEEEAEALRAEVNPFEAMGERNERRLNHLRIERYEMQDSLDRARERHSLLTFWSRGFKEVRLQEIGAALTELEIEVNSAVSALGLADWSLRFQVDRETQKGSIQRGFDAFVQSPHNDRAVPWRAWSGGEAQRLRLAGNMGLADLTRSRTGATINLEVWDEPTQGLSPSGVQDLLEALAYRARQESRQIWIVDHRSYDFGGFAGGAVIVKTKSGSLIRPRV